MLTHSGFQQWAHQHKLAVVIPDVTHEEQLEGHCFNDDCRSHRMAKQREASYEYLCNELDYIVSENHPVIKGKQSMLGVGKGAWLALTCGLSNPKNYSSVSVILTEPYSPNLIPLGACLPSYSKLLRNLNDHL